MNLILGCLVLGLCIDNGLCAIAKAIQERK